MKRQTTLYLLGFLLSFCIQNTLLAQGFGLPEEACPDNSVNFTSPEPTAPQHLWDFCTGDLQGTTPEAALVDDFINDPSTPFTDAWRPEVLEIVYDPDIDEWFGFIVNVGDRANAVTHSLLRMEFGNSLDNVPTYHYLGNVGGAIYDSPYQIKVLKSNGNWYGFMANNGFRTGLGTSLVRFNFGSSLRNIPSGTEIYTWDNPADSALPGFDIVKDNGDFKFIAVTYNRLPNGSLVNNEVLVLNFGNDLGNTFLTTTNTLPGIWSVPRRPKLIKENDNWYYIAFSSGSQTNTTLHRFIILDFGVNLESTPVVIDRSAQINWTTFGNASGVPSFDNSISYYNLDIFKDGKDWVLLTSKFNGNFIRLNFGESILNIPSIEVLGNFGIMGSQQLANRPMLTATSVKAGSTYYFFGINRHPNINAPFNVNQLVRLKFPNVCNTNIATSTAVNPALDFFSPGKYYFNLQTYDADRNPLNIYTDSLEIIPATVGNFIIEGQCLGEGTSLENTSFGPETNVSAWEWTIYEAGYSYDPSDPAPPILHSTNTRDLSYDFLSAGFYDVRLKVINTSGCENEIIKTVAVSNYPEANFRVEGINCTTGTVSFEDLSSAGNVPIQNRYWNFGDGTQWFASPNTATSVKKGIGAVGEDIQENTPYAVPGNYVVSLSITDASGCTSTHTQSLELAPAQSPQAQFSFSNNCVGAPTYFEDLSTLPAASPSIIRWHWDFDGLGESTLPNPEFIFPNEGNYTVTLTVSNGLSCDQSISQMITVRPSLESFFSSSTSFGVAPLSVQFRNETDGASSFAWEFGDGTISQDASPAHTFTSPGSYEVRFQARNDGGCGTLRTQTINVFSSPTDLEANLGKLVKIYPNPARSTIRLESKGLQVKEVQVFDALGKLLFHLKETTEEIDVSRLANGIYILGISTEQGYFKRRLVVSH